MCLIPLPVTQEIEMSACVLLKQKLGKKLLHLACWHHIMELVPSCSLSRQFALTSGPDVATCKRFQINWTNIDQTRYEPEAAHEEVTSLLKDDKDSLLAFSESQLHYSIIRPEMIFLLEPYIMPDG